jgi:hypothetical protein
MGYHTISLSLTIDGAAEAIEFYKNPRLVLPSAADVDARRQDRALDLSAL